MRIGRRPGFTLIELLTTLSIIGILFALLLPAVQSAREAARAIQCQNNLRQIGLALAGYTGDFAIYPFTGNCAYEGTPAVQGFGSAPLGFSPLSYLLPYLGHEPLYASINFDDQVTDGGQRGLSPMNQTAYGARVAGFLCPSDPSEYPINSGNNYRACINVGPASGIITGAKIRGQHM
jgi:prepilin-type N-terminal cleavage/methylation domain-containing protein